MRGVVPASATHVFKNERRERSSGIMVKRAWLVEETDFASDADHSSTTTRVQGCRIAGLLIVRINFLSSEISRMVPARASEMRV